MSNTFNIGRFWKYFKYDLINAKDSYLISLIVYGILPIITFFFYWLFAIVIGGESLTTAEAFLGIKISAYMIAYIGVTISFPIKAYGRITEKQYGTAWALLPASVLEKFLSAVLICCIMVPVCLLAVFYASSYILDLIVPAYGKPLGLHDLITFINNQSDGSFKISMVVIPLSWAESILTFLLGAVFFKRGKGGKTILCIMGLGCLISWMATAIFCNTDVTSLLERIDNITGEQALFWLNTIINVLYVIVFAALFTGLYLRMKTIKH